MPCLSPITVTSKLGTEFRVRCRQCLQCRIMKLSALSLRAELEFRMASSGEFWTLTYEHAPAKGSYQDFSSFLKRLRAQNARQGNQVPIRYLGVGEYGGRTGRFHFHGLIFNALCPTPRQWLERLWPHGFVYIGTVTPSSIRYTARYTTKFETKGREACAGWSKRPALGDTGMRYVADAMRRRGDNLPGPPLGFRIDGRSLPLDEAMRLSFWSQWTGKPVKLLREEGLPRLPDSMFSSPSDLIPASVTEGRLLWWEKVRASFDEF